MNVVVMATETLLGVFGIDVRTDQLKPGFGIVIFLYFSIV